VAVKGEPASVVSGEGEGLLPLARLEQAAQLLRVLTHPQRLRMCELLLQRDRSVGELALLMELKHNAVSQHLNHLRAYGIVAAQRTGREVYYRVVHPGPSWLLGCIRQHATGWPATFVE
jgi:DNA-binding transcriptional ArsR family regulator